MSDKKMDYRQLPNSIAAMENIESMRFAIAASGQPDPMAGKAITGMRADMILAQKEQEAKLQNKKVIEAAKPEFARGQVYRLKATQKIVTIMASVGKGTYEVVHSKTGKRKIVSYKDLEEV